MTRRRPLDKDLGESMVVDLRVPHPAAASEDQDRCDRREYWLLKSNSAFLLTADCETQWGADQPGPAQTELKGRDFRVKYTEYQSSDACETVDATITLAPLALKKQIRRRGTVDKNTCTHARPLPVDVPPGDGTPDHPLLLLHR